MDYDLTVLVGYVLDGATEAVIPGSVHQPPKFGRPCHYAAIENHTVVRHLRPGCAAGHDRIGAAHSQAGYRDQRPDQTAAMPCVPESFALTRPALPAGALGEAPLRWRLVRCSAQNGRGTCRERLCEYV